MISGKICMISGKISMISGSHGKPREATGGHAISRLGRSTPFKSKIVRTPLAKAVWGINHIKSYTHITNMRLCVFQDFIDVQKEIFKA